jgi:hypothetical protein
VLLEVCGDGVEVVPMDESLVVCVEDDGDELLEE